MNNTFLDALKSIAMGDIANVIGIIGGIYGVWMWTKERKRKKELLASSQNAPEVENFKTQIEHHRKVQSPRPYAFALSLIPTSVSIKEDVKEFLQNKGQGWDSMPIKELNFDGLKPGSIESFINKLRIKRREFEAAGATEIHLFIAGPVQAAVLVGAILDNWKPVMLYQKDRDTLRYEYWCPLTK